MINNELSKKIEQLEVCVKKLRQTGTDLADSERNYKIALCKQALKLRDDGLAVTMIDKVVYGIREIADLRFKRDVAESIYKSNLEAINSLKLQIRILHEQNKQDYGVAKYE